MNCSKCMCQTRLRIKDTLELEWFGINRLKHLKQ